VSITLDANVLLYASDAESPQQERALEVLAERASGEELLYLFWPALSAYLRLATHPSVFRRPLSLDLAIANLEDLLTRPQVRTPGEDDGFWPLLREVLAEGGARGNLVTDAHLVTLMRRYGVRTILTRDRDFRRFDGIRALDPFAG
jgi:toxin-antitoxin system PIN domain toxin